MSVTMSARNLPVATPALEAWTTRLWRAVYWALVTRSSRQVLAEMDDRMLSDIGASRADAVWEASRPVWDISIKR